MIARDDRTGVCVCGVPVAQHFTKRNNRLACEQVAHLRPAAVDRQVEQQRPPLRLVVSDRQSVARTIDDILWERANDKRDRQP